jgi:ABC-type multidrug transport system fused ATPase/permease subunit
MSRLITLAQAEFSNYPNVLSFIKLIIFCLLIGKFLFPKEIRRLSCIFNVQFHTLTNNQRSHKVKSQSQINAFSRLFKYNKNDLHLIIVGVLAALIHGCVFPSTSIILANMLEIFSMPQASNFRERANLFSLIFVILAVTAFISNSIQSACFNVVAERLSRKIRAEVFRKYVRMPIGWFDLPQNSPGALGGKLATDATLLNTLTSSVFGVFVQAASSFATGVIIAFVGVGNSRWLVLVFVRYQ